MTDTNSPTPPVVLTKEERQEQRRQEVANSLSYRITKFIAKWMDAYYLDPIIGFFLPGYGDIITAVLNIPFLFVSIFKLHSFKLTVAIILNVVIDFLVGLIPGAGDFLDIFVKSYAKNSQLLIDHVENGREINLKTILSSIGSLITFQSNKEKKTEKGTKKD